MKKLIFVSGTMGIGKTTITKQVAAQLDTTELTIPAAVTKMIQIINKASDLN